MKYMDRRYKMAYVSKDIILELFNERKEVCWIKIIKGVPKSTKVINIVYDHLRDCFCVLLEHPSFEPIPIDQVVPLVDIVYQKVYPGKSSFTKSLIKNILRCSNEIRGSLRQDN